MLSFNIYIHGQQKELICNFFYRW